MTHNHCSLRSITTIAIASFVLSASPVFAQAKTTPRAHDTQAAASQPHPKSPNRGRAQKKKHGKKGSSQKRGAHKSPKSKSQKKQAPIVRTT